MSPGYESVVMSPGSFNTHNTHNTTIDQHTTQLSVSLGYVDWFYLNGPHTWTGHSTPGQHRTSWRTRSNQ